MPATNAKPRASKHKKKAWKTIDLTEIDRYYQDKELDERTGQTGKPTFFISNEGNIENLTATSDKAVCSTTKKSNQIDYSNPTRSIVDNLDIYKHLKSTSQVPAFQTNEPIHPKQPVLNHIRLKNKEKKEIENVSKRRQIRLKDAIEKRKSKSRAFDLWEEKEKTPVHGSFVDYMEDFEHLHLAQLGKCAPKPTQTVQTKPSLLPACEVPHPGISYNPDELQHNELLFNVANKKKKQMREKKRLDRKIKEHFNPNIDVQAENMKDMLQGLSDNECEPMEQDENDVEPSNVLPTDAKHRKTKKQIRHELLQRQLKMLAEQKRQAKRFNSDFFRIRQYLRELNLKAKLSKQRRELKQKKEQEKLFKPARLGRQRYVEPDQEYNLPSELQGSIRKLNTDGNPLMDRFKSLQKRNLIEHRVVLKLGKSKPKRKKIVNQAIYNRDFYDLKNQTA